MALVTCLAVLTTGSQAQDKAADPTGTWTWTVERGGEKREVTLKLAAAGGKLTGTASTGKDGETKIEDGSFRDGEVSKYSGKLSWDAIKGSYETTFGGKAQKRDWEAKRAK
ncbi:hypothetical protein J0H58_31830 [bacterium]|nr:hypothetical protein [bacterium]